MLQDMTLQKRIRGVAYIMRFVTNVRAERINKQGKIECSLTIPKSKEAEQVLIKENQGNLIKDNNFQKKQ